MASDALPPTTAQQPIEGELISVLTISDEQILNLISAIHNNVPADQNFDADSLYEIVKNIHKRSIRIVRNLSQERSNRREHMENEERNTWGTRNGGQGAEHMVDEEEKVSRTNLDPLLCPLLKQLSSELACNAPGIESAHKTTMSILNKLSSYSWDAKAVLTLAAFAFDYEDFLALALKHQNLQKYEEKIVELSNIFKTALSLMGSIFDINKLSNNDVKDEPALWTYAIDNIIPVGVYWIIMNVVACSTRMCALITSNEDNTWKLRRWIIMIIVACTTQMCGLSTSDDDKNQKLSHLNEKLWITYDNLGDRIFLCNERIAKKKARRKLKELLRAPDEIVEVFKALTCSKDDMQPIIDGSTNEMVSIEVLKKKNVLLFITLLDIPEYDISILKRIYDGIRKKGYEYKIVWVPLVEQWTDDLRKKFERLRSKMPWYILQYCSPVGINFIKEEWYFKDEPIVVVIDPEGDVENDDALDMIRGRGMLAFLLTGCVSTLQTGVMQPVTAEQPIEGELNVLTMSKQQIRNLISATHILPSGEYFDADSLFVVVKNILKRATNYVDNVLLGQEQQEYQEENVSRASLDLLLCTLKQLSSEMACKSSSVEIVQQTTLSILNILSNYSWEAKAVLTLAAFALDYEEFLGLDRLHSSHQLAESVEIPNHVLAPLNDLDIQKYGKTIDDLNDIMNDTLGAMEYIFELKKLSTNDYIKARPRLLSSVVKNIIVGVYWIIMTVVACTTQMCCLTSDENTEKTQELLPLAHKINGTLCDLKSLVVTCHKSIEQEKKRRKLKEHLQTPDEITEVFKALIFGKDDMQPLLDGSTNETVDINVLEKKNVLLLISGMNISRDDISMLKPIYDGIRRRGYEYKIVWIPIVEQWTDDLQKKLEMLRSKMPWYMVQYFSPVAGIKFIKEEWHFENEPIVVVIDSEGNVENENALSEIRLAGMNTFPYKKWGFRFQNEASIMRPPGPYAIEDYTLVYGGKDNKWIKLFYQKVNVVAEHPLIKEANIAIKILSHIRNERKLLSFLKLTKTKETESDPAWNEEIQKLLLSSKNKSRWAVLIKWSTRIISDDGTTILKILESFDEWKVNVSEKGFEICFKEYRDKLSQPGSPP